jgi:group I intron endonuclease
MKNVIYKIINTKNNKFYVGSAVDFDVRRNRHLLALRKGTHHCAHLQAAWRKYGAGAFIFVVVEDVPDSHDLLDAENVWLHAHAAEDYCYNVARDAKAPMRNPSDETRAKMSKAMLGRFAGDKHYRFGQTVSDEVKEKIGAAQRGKPKAPDRVITPEGRAKIAAAAEAGHYASFKGKQHSAASRKLMGDGIVVLPSGRRFDTITEMREALGVPIATVHRSLRSNKPIALGAHKGLSFQYQDPEREAARLAAVVDKPKQKLGRPAGQVNECQLQPVRTVPEGKTYSSVMEFVRQNGVPRSAAYKMLEGKERDGMTLVRV